MQADVALVECGKCLLKQTITNIKQIEEPVDIFGHFVDDYYNNIDLHETPELETSESIMDSELDSQTQSASVEEASTEETILETEELKEEEEEEEEHQEPAQLGFVPRTKGDVLKKKHKDKDNKKNWTLGQACCTRCI